MEMVELVLLQTGVMAELLMSEIRSYGFEAGWEDKGMLAAPV
jgi:hypothetical protein